MTNTPGRIAVALRWTVAGLVITLAYMLGSTTADDPNAWARQVEAHGTVVQPVAPVVAAQPQVAAQPVDDPQVTALSDLLAAEDAGAPALVEAAEETPAPSTATTDDTDTVLTEDGSWVSNSYHDRVTTTGATQARCDYLGKQRVADATYGHRCV